MKKLLTFPHKAKVDKATLELNLESYWLASVIVIVFENVSGSVVVVSASIVNVV